MCLGLWFESREESNPLDYFQGVPKTEGSNEEGGSSAF